MRNFVKVLLVGTVLAGACVLLPNDVWAKVEKVQFSNGKTLYKGANGHYYSTHKAAELKQGGYYTASEATRRYGGVSSSGPVKLQTYVVNPNNGKGNMTVVNFYDDETSTTVNGNTYHRDASSGGISQARYINYQGTQYEAGRQNITNAVNVTEAGGVLGRSWTVTTDPTKKNQSGYVYVESANGAAKIYYPPQGTEGQKGYVPPSQVSVANGNGTVVARSYTDKNGNEIKVGMESRPSAGSKASAYMANDGLSMKAADGSTNASVTLKPTNEGVSLEYEVNSPAGSASGDVAQKRSAVEASQKLADPKGNSSAQGTLLTPEGIVQISATKNNGKISETGQRVTSDSADQVLQDANETVRLRTTAQDKTITSVNDRATLNLPSLSTSAASAAPVPKDRYVVVNGGVYEVFTAGDSKTITVDGRSYTWNESKGKWDSGSFWHKDLVQQADVSAIMGDGSHFKDVKNVRVFADGSSIVEFNNGSYLSQAPDGTITGVYEDGTLRVGDKRTNKLGTSATVGEHNVQARAASRDGVVVDAEVAAGNNAATLEAKGKTTPTDPTGHPEIGSPSPDDSSKPEDGDSTGFNLKAAAKEEELMSKFEGGATDGEGKIATGTHTAVADQDGLDAANRAKAEDLTKGKTAEGITIHKNDGSIAAAASAENPEGKNENAATLKDGTVTETSFDAVDKEAKEIEEKADRIFEDAKERVNSEKPPEKPAEEPLDDPLDAERKQMEQDWASTFPEGYEGRGDALLPNYYSESLAVNHDNASAIGNLLGGDHLGWSENGYTMTSEQAGTLKDLYGITFDSANQQIRFSGKEGDFGADIMNYMNQLSSVNGGKGYQSLLQDHAQNTNQYRYRQYAIDAAQVKVDEAQAKVKKLIVTKGTQKEIQKAREELGEAQKALGKAREDGKGDIDKYNATITELDSIVTAAKKNYTIAKSAALSTAENFFGNDTARSNQFADAINSSDFETARSLAYDALSNKTISPDEFVELNNKIAAVEGTKAEADAKEAEVNQVQQGAETPREVDLQDLVRIGTVAMTPLVTKTELALRDDVNILAGEIGPAVGAVDDTALSDVDVDASMPSTVSGSAMVVAELLKNANVDLKLLDETFEEEEAKTVVQTGTLAGAGSQAGTSASLEVPEEEKEEKPEDEKKYLTDEQVALIQAKRQMLLKQYVNAAVQISEGMNAVSNKFADRANVLISFSEGVQNEAGAFGLTQDVGRYILLESLRAVALSSAQMGVQAARLLNEREVDNEIQ